MRRQKKTKLRTTKLPPELCHEILTKLPIKPILRFRCVSKLWCSLIDNPHFTSAHLKNRQKLQDESHLLVLEPHDTRGLNQLCAIRRSDSFRRTAKHKLGVDCSVRYCATGHINGMLCIKKYVRAEMQPIQIFLWNPSIKKALEIPLPPIAKSKERLDIDCAFGFDPITDDYKIVASLYIHGEQHYPKFVDIYTLSKNSWKCLEMDKGPSLWDKHRPKAYLNGLIYWMGIDTKKTTPKGMFPHLVSFDVDREAFNYIDLPNCEIFDRFNFHERFPIILDRSIAIMDTYLRHTSIWVMGENYWARRYIINLSLLKKCVYLKSDGNLLYRGKKGGVNSYNLESKEVKVVAKSYKFVPFFTTAYRESLMLLNGFDDRNVFSFPDGEDFFQF